MKRTIFGFIAGVAAAIICFSVGCTINSSNPGTAVDLAASDEIAGTASIAETATPVPPQDQEVRAVPVNAQQLSAGRADVSTAVQTTPQTPLPTVALTPDPTVAPVLKSSLAPTSTPTPAPTSTPKPKASASPSSKPEDKIEMVISIGTASSEQPTVTQAETPKPTPTTNTTANTEQTGGMTAISADYISEVLRAINDARASEGNSAVKLDSSFSDLAASHAKEMAEAGRMYHSKYRMIESVGKGTVGGMEPYSTGAYSAYHAPQIARDANVTSVGIGGWIKDGTLYICIVAE